MDLLKLLELLATGGAAIAIAYRIIERWPWATALDPEPRRWAASGIAGVIGMLAWLLQMGLGVWPQPVSWQEWITTLGGAAIMAGWIADKVHGRRVLSKLMRGYYRELKQKPPPYRAH